MAEKFTMSEQLVGDGGAALDKKMKQEEEPSHRVVVDGDGGGGVLEEKKKQEQQEEPSHRVVVGNSGGGVGVLEEKKKQEQESEESHRVVVVVHCPPPQKTNRHDLRAAARAAVPYKTRVIEEILNDVGALSFAIALCIVLGAFTRFKEIDGNLSLSLVFFVISTIHAFLMDLKKRHTTIDIISFTITTTLGWGILVFALIVNHRSSSCSAFTIGDLEIFFRSCALAIPHWILNAAFNLAN